jgi:hypothetical protein
MTKTHAENAPSDALTAWRKAFFHQECQSVRRGICPERRLGSIRPAQVGRGS